MDDADIVEVRAKVAQIEFRRRSGFQWTGCIILNRNVGNGLGGLIQLVHTDRSEISHKRACLARLSGSASIERTRESAKCVHCILHVRVRNTGPGIICSFGSVL